MVQHSRNLVWVGTVAGDLDHRRDRLFHVPRLLAGIEERAALRPSHDGVGGDVAVEGIWTQVNHNWFTTLFSMVAAWAALANVEHAQRWLRWPLIAGVAAGMAAMVTPHRGALVMLAALTAFLNLRRHRAELIVYVLGCALAPVGLLAYVVWHHALAAAFDDVIRFTAERYAPVAQRAVRLWG